MHPFSYNDSHNLEFDRVILLFFSIQLMENFGVSAQFCVVISPSLHSTAVGFTLLSHAFHLDVEKSGVNPPFSANLLFQQLLFQIKKTVANILALI